MKNNLKIRVLWTRIFTYMDRFYRHSRLISGPRDAGSFLIDGGFDPDDISVRSILRYCPSLSECILLEQNETQYSTIVVGRQGLSRSEEFLFGSISSKIVNHARNCTVWVVE